MKNSTNQKSKIQGIEDLSFDQISIFEIDAIEKEKFHKRIFALAIGLLIGIISFCITYADLFQF